MAHRPLPVGHHTADEVVELLGMKSIKSKRRLYQRLRELGWLIVDKNGVRGGNHNLPRREIIDRGWAYPWTCSYGAGADKTIDREYRIPVFTPEGYAVIKGIFKEGKPAPEIRAAAPVTKLKPAAPEPTKEEVINDPATRQAANATLESLKKMGIF